MAVLSVAGGKERALGLVLMSCKLLYSSGLKGTTYIHSQPTGSWCYPQGAIVEEALWFLAFMGENTDLKVGWLSRFQVEEGNHSPLST